MGVIVNAAKTRDAKILADAAPKVTGDALDGELPPRGQWLLQDKLFRLAWLDSSLRTAKSVELEYHHQATLRPWNDMMTHLESIVGPFKGLICDIGCGTGVACAHFLKRSDESVRVWGIDAAPELVAAAKAHHQDCSFVCADAANMQVFPELHGSAAGVWCSFTAAHFPGKKLDKAVAEWMQLLQPGGWLCMLDLDGYFSVHRPFQESRYSIDFRQLDDDLQTLIKYDVFVGKRLAQVCKKAKLEIIDEREWPGVTEYNFSGPGSADQVAAWAARMDREPLKKVLKNYFRDFEKKAKEQFLGCLR